MKISEINTTLTILALFSRIIKILENYTFDLASKVEGFSRVTLKNPSHFSTA